MLFPIPGTEVPGYIQFVPTGRKKYAALAETAAVPGLSRVSSAEFKWICNLFWVWETGEPFFLIFT